MACYSPRGHKESDTTEGLNNSQPTRALAFLFFIKSPHFLKEEIRSGGIGRSIPK